MQVCARYCDIALPILSAEMPHRLLVAGTRLRPSTSYAKSYDSRTNKRQRLNLPTPQTSDQALPPLPVHTRVDEKENEVLLPQTMSLLSSMPGAQRRANAVSGRDTVLYKGVVFVDTHTLQYLDGCSPDVTITQDGLSISSFVALALLELQVGR
jgi:hypothetical protein